MGKLIEFLTDFTEPSQKSEIAAAGVLAPERVLVRPVADVRGPSACNSGACAVEPTDWLAWTQAFQLVDAMICSPTRNVLELPSVTTLRPTFEPNRQKMPAAGRRSSCCGPVGTFE